MSAAPRPREFPPGSAVILIGLRGVGKSAVAARLARRLNRQHVDTDALIESNEGRSIRDIFDRSGEPAFREIEAGVVADCCRRPRLVISVGGGAVLRAENRAAMRAAGVCVWLTASLAEMGRRLAEDPQSYELRPSLTGQPIDAELADLFAARRPIYEQIADLTLDTTALDLPTVERILLERLRAFGLAAGDAQ